MLSVTGLGMQFGGRVLFKDLSLTFAKGECYGVIGANGAGKSTFLKILSGQLEPTYGHVNLDKEERISVLRQDHDAFDGETVKRAVLLGNPELVKIMDEKDRLYAKADFTDADGIRAGELEARFQELDGWDSDTDVANLLTSLGVPLTYQDRKMGELDVRVKVKVLLAQALFGKPDILLMDEPTNGLDGRATDWLEDYLADYENTLIVVSHDRYFLNKVCTKILDVDYGVITPYVGNYEFWYESSQLAQRQAKELNAKKEEKVKELKDFIARFAANASKSRQATSRKKMLEKITIEDIKPSSRRYPYIDFKPDREIGNDVLTVEGLGVKGKFSGLTFVLTRTDKVAFISDDTSIITSLFDVLADKRKDYVGKFKFGITVKKDYFPAALTELENIDLSLVDYLRPFAKEQLDSYIRGYLGRMVFSGDEALKKVSVLSGGEKVRLKLTKMMMDPGNLLIFDDPTNHLDLESVQSLNTALEKFTGVVLIQSHDRELVKTIANRFVFMMSDGKRIDIKGTYDEAMAKAQALLAKGR